MLDLICVGIAVLGGIGLLGLVLLTLILVSKVRNH